MTDDRVVLRARGLTKSFPLRRGMLGRTLESVRAVDGIDLDVPVGTTVGIVGESGSGKTTVGRLLARLLTPDQGAVEVEGEDVTRIRGPELKRMRARLQIIFQDPYGALDPTKTVGHAVGEPLIVHGRIRRGELREHARRLLERVALGPRVRRPVPRRAVGRTAAAGLHRPRAGAVAEHPRRRRADLRARPVHPVGDPQPAAGDPAGHGTGDGAGVP